MGKLVTVDVSFKRFFYDREAVKKKLDKKRLGALRRAGLTIRLAARRRLRRRKRASAAGESPSVHSKDNFATLKNIQAGFDTFREASVVGPIGFGNLIDPVPGRLEDGYSISRKNERRTVRRLGEPGEIEALPMGGGPAGRDKSTGKFTKAKQRLRTNSREIEGYDKRRWKVAFATLETQAQVRRANKLNELLYGPMEITGEIEPRPFMEPAVDSVKDQLVDLYLSEGT